MLRRLGVVVDPSAPSAKHRDYQVRGEDFEAWEAEHGRLPEGAIVLLRTGWAERWGARARLGSKKK